MIQSISTAVYFLNRSSAFGSQLSAITSAPPGTTETLSSQAWPMTSSSDDESFADSTYDSSGVVGLSTTIAQPEESNHATKAGLSDYGSIMPTRAGFSDEALFSAIADPSVQTLSKGLSTNQVASAARESIDAAYKKMKIEGQPFDINSPGGKDWYSAMGQLDRRALNAVSTNSGGMFTKDEQDMAQSIMTAQQGMAMGLYSGPTNQQSTSVDLFQGGAPSARFKAEATWLDKVSDDEKSSIGWAFNRASAQVAYSKSASGLNYDDSVESSDPRVSLIATAMGTMSSSVSRSYTLGTVESKDDLLNQPWFSGFEDKLNAILQSKGER